VDLVNYIAKERKNNNFTILTSIFNDLLPY